MHTAAPDVETLRTAERLKYEDAYRLESYRMGEERRRRAAALIGALPHRGRLLDVGTGRGELLEDAERLGYEAQGTEVVEYLCNERVTWAEGRALPFEAGEFDVVTCFDVLEHVLPQDTAETLTELARVTGKVLLCSIATYSHVHQGVELHPNRRTAEGWVFMMQTYIPGAVLIEGGITQWWRWSKCK